MPKENGNRKMRRMARFKTEAYEDLAMENSPRARITWAKRWNFIYSPASRKRKTT